jgi:predicted dehydrogenase
VLGEEGLLVATDTMGQTPGGTVTLTRSRDESTIPVTFASSRSPFAAQAAAFQAAAKGVDQGFSLDRDLALMRMFDPAYRRAIACL